MAAITFVLSLGVALAVWSIFRWWGIHGDCAPHEMDGQCGMSTAFGKLIGLVAGAVVMILGILGTMILWSRRR